MEDADIDVIRWFMKDFKKSGILQELKRRSYFLSRTQRRRFKDLLNMKRKKKAESRKAHSQQNREKGKTR